MPSPYKTYKLDTYTESSYDRHLCLKPSLLLWIAILYLSRAIALPILARLSAMSGSTADIGVLFQGLIGLEAFVPAAVTLFVILAYIRRTPSASPYTRWVWAHGRAFLATAAVLDLGLSLWFSWDTSSGPNGAALVPAALDVYLLCYVLGSKRVRHVFSDFPAPESAESA